MLSARHATAAVVSGRTGDTSSQRMGGVAVRTRTSWRCILVFVVASAVLTGCFPKWARAASPSPFGGGPDGTNDSVESVPDSALPLVTCGILEDGCFLGGLLSSEGGGEAPADE